MSAYAKAAGELRRRRGEPVRRRPCPLRPERVAGVRGPGRGARGDAPRHRPSAPAFAGDHHRRAAVSRPRRRRVRAPQRGDTEMGGAGADRGAPRRRRPASLPPDRARRGPGRPGSRAERQLPVVPRRSSPAREALRPSARGRRRRSAAHARRRRAAEGPAVRQRRQRGSGSVRARGVRAGGARGARMRRARARHARGDRARGPRKTLPAGTPRRSTRPHGAPRSSRTSTRTIRGSTDARGRKPSRPTGWPRKSSPHGDRSSNPRRSLR